MNKKVSFFVLIIFFLSFLNASSNEDGITIVSNKLNVDMNKRKSIFKGDVHAYNETLKVWSDEMTIILKIEKDEINEILANGNVKIIRLVEGSEIYGDAANYSLEEEVIIITGNVVVIENGNKVSGSELVVDLKSSSSIMVGSDSKRVEALIVDN
jgi:lipopolysaccharide transport protein LptA